MSKLIFKVLPGKFSYFHLLSIPEKILESTDFYTISRTSNELSVFCNEKLIEQFVNVDSGWKVLELQGIFDLEAESSVGITSKFSTALAKKGINLCTIATFNTDYLLVKEKDLVQAKQILMNAGFEFI